METSDTKVQSKEESITYLVDNMGQDICLAQRQPRFDCQHIIWSSEQVSSDPWAQSQA